ADAALDLRGAWRPQLARLHPHVQPAEEGTSCCRGLLARVGTRVGEVPVADRAPPARLGIGIVERLLQELHQTPFAVGVAAHQVRFGSSYRAQLVPLGGIEVPLLPGTDPTAL